MRVSQGHAERKLGRPRHSVRCSWQGPHKAIKRDFISKAKGIVGVLWNAEGNLVTNDAEKAETFNPFFYFRLHK